MKDILDRFDSVSTDTDIKQLAQTVQKELVDDEDMTYLISYVDEQGEERVQSVNVHPRELNDKEVLQYKRISSVDEVFE